MKALLSLGLAVFLALPVPTSFAASASLTTTFAAGNGNQGKMFDVAADRDLYITSLQFAFFAAPPFTSNFEIYTKSGTYVGSEGDAAVWTLTESGTAVVPAATSPSSVIQLTKPIKVDAGETVAFYIRRDAGDVTYTNGTGSGTLLISDGNLRIFEGIGLNNLFGAAIADRITGKSRILSLASRETIYGVARSELGIERVRVRYKRQRASGSTRNVSTMRTTNAAGVFRFNVKTFDGRNPIRFTAVDKGGRLSKVARVVVTGQ
jgi:Ca2+-binding RTX toxin-like protein